jgi:hypothetical protein
MLGGTGGLAWKVRRRSVMSGSEIYWRIKQFISLQVEALLVRWGWQPRLLGSMNHNISWLNHHQPENLIRPMIDELGREQLLKGKIDFFGGSSLCVGMPTQWHKDPLTGRETPRSFGPKINYRDSASIGDAKYVWELGRHQHLVALAADYALHGDLRCKQKVVADIEHWVVENPFGVGIHWCSTLEVALRLIAWAMIHSLLYQRDQQGLLEAVNQRDAVVQSIYQQQWFIRHHLSLHSSANNHLIGELSGLWLSISVFSLGEQHTRQQQWLDFAQNMLEQEAEKQVYDDGVNKEQAFYYHLWVLEYFLLLWCVGQRTQRLFSQVFEQRLLAMASFLRTVMPERGEPPQVGDSDNGFVLRFRHRWPEQPYHEVLHAVAMVFGQGSISPSPHVDSCDKGFWLYQIVPPASLGHMLAWQRHYPAIYEQGGYAVLGDERCHIVFDAGSLGYPEIAAHGHADALSFCLAVDDQWWFVDPGTYAYHTQEDWRQYFRGTSAHNTMCVDHHDQSQSGGTFLWLRHAQAQLKLCNASMKEQVVSGYHDGYQCLGVEHQRTMRYRSGDQELYISDHIICHSLHKFEFYFHLDPSVTVERNEKTWLLRHKDNAAMMVSLSSTADLQWTLLCGSDDPKGGWFSHQLGCKQPCYTLLATVDAHSDITMPFTIKLLSSGEHII